MKSLTLPFKVCVSSLFVTASVCASVTATQSFTVAQTPEPFSQPFSFSQFNTNLGTLTGIHFTMTGTESSTATVTNIGTSSGTFSYISQADLFITDLSGIVYSEVFPTFTQMFTLDAGASRTFTGVTASSSGEVDYTGNSDNSTTFTLAMNSENGSPADPIDVSPFLGSGAVSLFFEGDNNSSCPGGQQPSRCSSVSGTGGGAVSLYYSYVPAATTSTPEPATFLLLGSALGCWALLESRRQKVVTSSDLLV